MGQWPDRTMGYSCIRWRATKWLKRITVAMKVLVEVVGWVGAIMKLSAYVLLTLGRLKSQSPVYHWLNIVSGAGLIVNCGFNGAYPSVCIFVVWLIIGLFGVFSTK